MNTEVEGPALIKNNYFRAILICGIICTVLAFGVGSMSDERECKDYYVRYCDYKDRDTDICFRKDSIYCCHRERHHHRRWHEECGSYGSCYEIVEEYEYRKCNHEQIEAIGAVLYLMALGCLVGLGFLYWQHHKAKDEARERQGLREIVEMDDIAKSRESQKH